jgi:hypothetical protein
VAYEDFWLGAANAAAAGLVRHYPRANLQGTDAAVVTGWTDETGNADATLAGSVPASNVPVYIADPGDGNGPVCRYTDDLGWAAGTDGGTAYVGGTVWVFYRLTTLADVSGFQNILSDDSGNGFDFYLDGTTWTLVDGANTDTFGTAVGGGTEYRIVVVRTATNYRIYLNGVLAHTTAWAPTETPEFVTSAFGGTGAPFSGDEYVWGFYDVDVSADIALLDAAMSAERTPNNDQELALSAHTEAVVLPGPSVASQSGQTVALSALVEPVALPGPALAIVTPQTLATSAHVETAVLPGPTLASQAALALSLSALVETVVLAGPTVANEVGFDDDFAGDGALLGYQTINASAISTLGRVSGRYRALVPAGDSSVTTWFDLDAGRLDYKWVDWSPGTDFTITWRNVGIGTSADSQVTPSNASNRFQFSGPHWNGNPSDPTAASAQVTVGHRGPESNTIEGKVTDAGDSTVDSTGDATLTNSRADIRIRFRNIAGVKSVFVEWSEPGAEVWAAYDDGFNAAGSIGTLPTFPDTVAIGYITYGFEFVDEFVGTCESVALVQAGQDVTLSGHVEAVALPGPTLAAASSLPLALGALVEPAVIPGPTLAVVAAQALAPGAHVESVVLPGPALAAGTPLAVTTGALAELVTLPGPTLAVSPPLDAVPGVHVEAVSLPGPTVALGGTQLVALSALVVPEVLPGPTVLNDGLQLMPGPFVVPVVIPGSSLAGQAPLALALGAFVAALSLPGPSLAAESPGVLSPSALVVSEVLPGPTVTLGPLVLDVVVDQVVTTMVPLVSEVVVEMLP